MLIVIANKLEGIVLVEVLVLYYSRAGKTEALAKAVADGARSVEGVTVLAKRVDYATVNDFISCDAVAFGSPNYFSYMAGLMKDYFDKAFSVRDKVAGKLAAAFTDGGGASNTALLSLENLIAAFKLEKAAEGVFCQGPPSEEVLSACKKLGETLAKAAVKKAKK